MYTPGNKPLNQLPLSPHAPARHLSWHKGAQTNRYPLKLPPSYIGSGFFFNYNLLRFVSYCFAKLVSVQFVSFHCIFQVVLFVSTFGMASWLITKIRYPSWRHQENGKKSPKLWYHFSRVMACQKKQWCSYTKCSMLEFDCDCYPIHSFRNHFWFYLEVWMQTAWEQFLVFQWYFVSTCIQASEIQNDWPEFRWIIGHRSSIANS